MRSILLLALVAGAPLSAQDHTLAVPSHWKVRADHGTPTLVATDVQASLSDTVFLVTMPPGWHLTTGPAIIAYDPAWQAAGRYRVEAEIFLFPGDYPEGYGLFIGGRDLEGDGQAYLYVLLRKDGHYLVKRRSGTDTETLVPWTAHAAIVPHTGQEGTAKNVLALDVAAEAIRILVNGETVTTVARDGLSTDGQVGLRVNHALNLHVARVEIETGS